MRAGRLFVGVTWIVGIATGLLLGRVPAIDVLPMPALVLPLAAGLLFDLAVQTGLVRVPERVSMNERAVGVIGGGLIAIGLSAALR